MGIQDRIKANRQDIISLAKKYGASNVRIFGSVARGEQHTGSDLDILIQLASGRSLFDIIALKQALEDLLNCKVDVVTEAALSPYIREEVVKSAINL